MEPPAGRDPELRTVFHFTEPGAYLKTLFEQEKRHSVTLTHAQFAQRLGVSLSLFRMILSGRRALTVDNIHQMASALRLNPAEHEFFEWMVLASQAQGDAARNYYQRKMRSALERSPEARVRFPAKALTRHWFVPALVVWLIDVHRIQVRGFEGIEAASLARVFGVSMGEMNEALSDIQQLGLFERLPDGGVKLSLNRLVHAGTTKRHIASVGQAAASQVDVRFEERNTLFETCALSLSRLDFENFVVEFKRLVETFGSIEVKAGDEVGVFQLFCAVWPTTSQAP